MRLLFVQHGRFAEDYTRLAAGGAETYRDQRASVMYVADMADHHQVTILTITEDPFDETPKPDLRCIGLPFEALDAAKVAWLFDEVQPDRLICRTPHFRILREAQKRRTPTLPCFADIFSNNNLRALYRNLRLSRALTGRHLPCIANHSLNATRSISSALFLPKNRVVPWDWSRVPVADVPKAGVVNPAAPTAFFAGMLHETKGTGDILRAVRAVLDRGLAMTATLAGPGDLDHWRAEAAALGISGSVSFLGRIAYEDVRMQMQAHDMVMVPSRHEYPEGLPNTIYEALASRSALIISNHPAFQGRLRPNQECLVFKASDPGSLSECILRLCGDKDLYATLSGNAPKALDELYVGLPWVDLVSKFLDDPMNASGWVAQNSLKTLGF